jgi:transposase InsO family protein
MEDRFLEDGSYEEPAGSEPAADCEPPGPPKAGAHGRHTSEADLPSDSSGLDEPAPLTPTVGDAASDSPPDGAAAEESEDARAPAFEDAPARVPPLASRARGRRLVRKTDTAPHAFTAEQRLLLLDTWRRSGLPAGDFAPLVGVSKHTLYAWQRRFVAEGPAGLVEQPRGAPKGSKLPDLTRRTILMLKTAHPDWGCERISDMLWRGPALPASPSAVARVLHEAGYELEETPTRPHPPAVRRFERARPNELWQTDLFTFLLKRQNRRVYLVAFMDDHSRFITSYGLHAAQSASLVIEVLRAGVTGYGPPQEILTDNGAQYVTWRGKSAFAKELEQRGIRQIVASPRRPQTLGKIERFWGTLWRELIETAIFLDLEDARRRIGLFIDYYNFQRTNQGIDGLVPADRFFAAASSVFQALQARVAQNALELARHGVPKRPFYLTGQVGGKSFSIHTAGERVILTDAQGLQQEIELARPNTPPEMPKLDEPAGTAGDGSAAADHAAHASTSEPLLPEPLCPDGSLAAALPDESVSEPPVPGDSPLDQVLPEIAAALDPRRCEEGGADL